MKTINLRRLAAGTFLAAACFAAGTAAQAAGFDFHVDLSGALSGVNGPYGINFQLIQGQPAIGNATTVTLSNFSFVGGSASGAPDFSFSTGTGASGSIASGFTLNVGEANTYSDILQNYSNGTSLIGFDVHVDSNVGTGFTPDGFSIHLLDGNSAFIPSSAPDGSSFVILPVNFAANFGDVQTYSGSGVTPAVSAVPEPSTYGLMGAGAGAAAAIAVVRRRRKAAKAA